MSEIANCLAKIETSNLSEEKKQKLCRSITGILDKNTHDTEKQTLFRSLVHVWFNTNTILKEISKSLHNNYNFCFLNEILIIVNIPPPPIPPPKRNIKTDEYRNVPSRWRGHRRPKEPEPKPKPELKLESDYWVARHVGKNDETVEVFNNHKYLVDIHNCRSDIIAIPIGLQFLKEENAHANMLIINRKTKTIDHFDPHGVYNDDYTMQEIINNKVNILIRSLFNLNFEYQITHPDATCPALQGFVGESEEWGGTCAMFTMFYAIKRLLNPIKSHSEINKEIETIFQKSSNPVNTIIYITKSLTSLLNIDEKNKTVNSRKINNNNSLRLPEAYILKNPDLEWGSWVNSSGSGEVILPNKTRIIGRFKNGEPIGETKTILPDNTVIDAIDNGGLVNGLGKITYPDGSVYEGHIENNAANGVGKVIFLNGLVYEGYMEDNLVDGMGKITYPNGSVYEGYVTHGQIGGPGTRTQANGTIEIGYFSQNPFKDNAIEFKDNAIEGDLRYGSLSYNNGDVYEGLLLNNEISKQGLMKYGNGDKYYGQWKNGKKHGHGAMIYANGDMYRGYWQDDKIHGYGIFKKPYKIKFEGLEHERVDPTEKKAKLLIKTYINGDTYKGNLNNINERDGQGIMIYANGGSYQGNWLNNKKSGQGIFRYANGDIYEGNWLNDKKSGQGTFNYNNGGIYEGNWINDEKSGQGTFHYKHGDIYEGEWKNDIKHGKGTMKYSGVIPSPSSYAPGRMTVKDKFLSFFYSPVAYEDVIKYEGEWKNDEIVGEGTTTYKNGDTYTGKLIDGMRSGKGIMTYTNGDRYKGEWVKNSKHGNGEIKYANGDVYRGNWKNDEKSGQGTMTTTEDGNSYKLNWLDGKLINGGAKIKKRRINYTKKTGNKITTKRRTQRK